MVGDRIAEEGFSVGELRSIADKFDGNLTLLHDLLPFNHREGNEAAVLLIRGGVEKLGFNPDELMQEQNAVDYDKKEYSSRFKSTRNSLARHNIVFGPQGIPHSADYQQNTVVGWAQVPRLADLRESLPSAFGNKAHRLNAEGNNYYDASSCGIGYHGDSERKIVICCCLGATSTLRYYWRAPHTSSRFSSAASIRVQHGDIYIMSEKATGWDWRRTSRYRLVHAAGASKYID
jgi:alkylated DNA repair dioxygenase AlkB